MKCFIANEPAEQGRIHPFTRAMFFGKGPSRTKAQLYSLIWVKLDHTLWGKLEKMEKTLSLSAISSATKVSKFQSLK